MTVSAVTPSQEASAAGITHAALDSLASRMRQGGLFLMMLRADGSLAYSDHTPAPFFQKYVLPAVQSR